MPIGCKKNHALTRCRRRLGVSNLNSRFDDRHNSLGQVVFQGTSSDLNVSTFLLLTAIVASGPSAVLSAHHIPDRHLGWR